MKIFVTGTRGIPGIPGGVEKHCEQLYPHIVVHGHEVILATRTPYVTRRRSDWNGVRLVHLYAPRNKRFEAIIHTFLAVLKAKSLHVDILHIHAVGPGLLVPLARLLGLNVVVTNHGPDYDRDKWGTMAKVMLRLGEYFGARYASEVIVISTVIADIVRKYRQQGIHLIYNGVPPASRTSRTDFLEKSAIKPGNYLLAVARFVPEKGLHDLLVAFRQLDAPYQLVIAGDADHESGYSRTLKKQAGEDERVILTGYIGGDDLQQVFSHARLFVLPSYHEGLPLVLLEAMSYGLPVLVSDIPANMEVALPEKRYFACGDTEELIDKIKLLMDSGLSQQERLDYQQKIAGKYNWPKIAQQTIAVYEQACSSGHDKQTNKP